MYEKQDFRKGNDCGRNACKTKFSDNKFYDFDSYLKSHLF